MKKVSLLMALIITVLLSGCGVREAFMPVSTPEPSPEPTLSPEQLEIKSFYDKYINTSYRNIGVMVDNDDKNARPQAGLDEAYLVYEIVVEGNATRYFALFKNAKTEKIGPVRSSRHYFLDYVLENDAIYTHFGWSPRAAQDIKALNINKINGVLGGEDESIFWRERKYSGDWHSAYTKIENIEKMADKKGYARTGKQESVLDYGEEYKTPEGTPATTITLPYAGFYKTGYKYNEETKLYEKTLGGAPYKLQNGNTLTTKNVIIQFVGNYSLGDGSDRQDIGNKGSGNGYYISEGQCVPITWEKADRSSQTKYKLSDGAALVVNPGVTFINLISPSAGTAVQ